MRCGAVRKSAGKAAAPSELHHQAGYFALCALARLDVLVGDYGGAVAAVAAGDIDLADEGEPFARVLTCRLNLPPGRSPIGGSHRRPRCKRLKPLSRPPPR